MISLIDLEEGKLYDEPVHEAQIRIEDNMKFDKAIITYGDTTETIEAEDLKDSPNYKIQITESGEPVNVSVVAYDAAGNESQASLGAPITVTTNPIALWMHNTPLFAGSIVAVIVVVIGAIALIMRRRAR